MKRFLIISLLALFACSCTKITKFEAPSDYEFWQYEKKVDGKKLYGIVFKKHIKFMLGEYGILEEEPSLTSSNNGIPCLYDSISFEKICGKEYMFVCKKDGQTYYHLSTGKMLAGGNPVTKVEYMNDSSEHTCLGYTHDFKFHTNKGIYTKSLGPHEDVCIDHYGYAIKENGKWGFVRDYDFWNTGDRERYKQVLPCEFDEFADVLDLTKYCTVIILARRDKNWECYDGVGNKIPLKKDWLDTVMHARKKNKSDRPIYRVIYE